MENKYVYNFNVRDLATKKTSRISVIATSVQEVSQILFNKFGSNYASRCELTSFYPCKEEKVK